MIGDIEHDDIGHDDDDYCDDDDDEIDMVDEARHLETISRAVSHKGLSHTHMLAMQYASFTYMAIHTAARWRRHFLGLASFPRDFL